MTSPRSLKICVVSFSNIGRDGRVKRQIEALREIADVTTIGYGGEDISSNCHHQIPDSAGYLPLTLRGLLCLLSGRFESAYESTPAVRFSETILSNQSFDVVVLNDVQTVGLIGKIGSASHTIVDMHEYAPEEMSDDWRFRVLLQRYYRYLCQTFLRRATRVSTVSESIATKFKEAFGVECVVVRNSCAYRECSPNWAQSEKIRLVHSGLASKGRHLEIMIQAASGLPNVELDLYLVKAPRQSRYFRSLLKYAERSSGVKICEPVPSEQLIETLSRYDVGLLTIAPSNFSLANCLPNKLFEFVQARLMIVAGPTPDVAKIVETYALGVVHDDFSVASLRRALRELTRQQIDECRMNSEEAALQLSFARDKAILQEIVITLVVGGT